MIGEIIKRGAKGLVFVSLGIATILFSPFLFAVFLYMANIILTYIIPMAIPASILVLVILLYRRNKLKKLK